jgi:hypothetical protein
MSFAFANEFRRQDAAAAAIRVAWRCNVQRRREMKLGSLAKQRGSKSTLEKDRRSPRSFCKSSSVTIELDFLAARAACAFGEIAARGTAR